MFSWPTLGILFADLWGDLESTAWVLEKQLEFQRLSFDLDGQWTYSHAGVGFSFEEYRKLGMAPRLWPHLQDISLVDDATLKRAFPMIWTLNWKTDDGKHHFADPDTWCFLYRCIIGLVGPEGTYDLGAMLGNLRDPADPLLDDNQFKTVGKASPRIVLGELLERAGMYEQALAQVQPTIAFSSCNTQCKIGAWLLIARCHAALGHKHHAAAVIDDALREARRTGLLLCEYEAAAHLVKFVLAPGPASDEAMARGREQLAAARAQLTGPAALLDGLAAAPASIDGRG